MPRLLLNLITCCSRVPLQIPPTIINDILLSIIPSINPVRFNVIANNSLGNAILRSVFLYRKDGIVLYFFASHYSSIVLIIHSIQDFTVEARLLYMLGVFML